jgi:GNAT superfamily N-acetyltransferase
VIVRDEPFASATSRQLIDAWRVEMSSRIRDFVPERASMARAADFEPPRGVFVVAWADETAVGCAGLRRLTDGVGEIKRVFVAPAARRRGVARALLTELEDRARTFGYETLRLDTDGGDPGALALFCALGYDPIEDYNANPYARHWFQKRIGR